MQKLISLSGRRSVYSPSHNATRKSEYSRDDFQAAWESHWINP